MMADEIRLLQEPAFDSPEGQEILSLLQSVQSDEPVQPPVQREAMAVALGIKRPETEPDH
jgi:hypothetical protein